MADNRVREAVLLAGGKGTRLRDVVADRPKPLADIGGRPFIEWLICSLRDQGVEHIIVAVGHMAEMVMLVLGDEERFGIELTFVRDGESSGTAGAVRNAFLQAQNDDVVVMNADSFTPYDLDILARKHFDSNALATLQVVEIDDGRRYGHVDLSENGRITAFREKSDEPGKLTVNAGVYVLNRGICREIPASGHTSLEVDVFPALGGNAVFGVKSDGPLVDIGTPDSYMWATKHLPELIGRHRVSQNA